MKTPIAEAEKLFSEILEKDDRGFLSAELGRRILLWKAEARFFKKGG